MKMRSEMFFHIVEEFDDVPINIYFYAENSTWLFSAHDIHNVFNKMNQDIDSADFSLCISERNGINKINIFQNDKWETVDVLKKEDILALIKNTNFPKVKKFGNWVITAFNGIPEESILSKDSSEYEFLNLATNRFLDLFSEINNSTFMNLSPEIRLYKIKDFFSIYTELLLYEPIKEHLKFVEKARPSMEAVISKEVVKFIRNIMAHFPLFTTWDEIYVSKKLINWINEDKSIDRFLKKYQGHERVLYRFKERDTGEWRYPEIKFPKKYDEGKIYLKDMVSERDGVLLCAILMFEVVSSQIIDIKE